jgi:hypothetical protein
MKQWEAHHERVETLINVDTEHTLA